MLQYSKRTAYWQGQNTLLLIKVKIKDRSDIKDKFSMSNTTQDKI